MNNIFGEDPYLGQRSRVEFNKVQLGVVGDVDPDSGLVSGSYVSGMGGFENALVMMPYGVEKGYGMFALPTVGSEVEVYTLFNNRLIARPAMQYYKAAVKLEVSSPGLGLPKLTPGEFLWRSPFGQSMYFMEDGGVNLNDLQGCRLQFDSRMHGAYLRGPNHVRLEAGDALLEMGVVRRTQLVDLIMQDEEVDSLPGMSPYQELRARIYPAQVPGVTLMKFDLKVGDIFNDAAIPVLDPTMMATLNTTTIAGSPAFSATLSRLGALTMTSPMITLNSLGAFGVGRVGDSVKSTVVEDAAFWGERTAFATFMTGLQALTGPLSPIKALADAYAAALLALVPPGSPTSMTGKIITGSTTVKAGS